LSLDLLALVTWMLFTLGMKAKEMDLKFQEGVDLWNQGKSQEGAEIWMDLAELGHLESIEQLVYIFFDQKDFDFVETLINYAKDPNEPIILYLKARKIEESVGFEESVKSFEFAVKSGSADACRRLFNAAIYNEDIVQAEIYLEKLRNHPAYFANPYVSVTFEDLNQELVELKLNQQPDDFDSESANDVLKALATNPSCPDEILTKLAKESDLEVRSAVAENTSTPADVLKTLAKDKDKEVRASVTRNISTPAETLAVMAKSAFLRVSIAENPSISIELLKELSVDKDEYVRHGVALNPNTPPEILQILANDTGYMIRDGVASNRNTPPELLKELALDDNATVRFHVALNPSAPLNLRTKLIKGLATATLDEYGYGRGFLAQSPDTPVEVIELFSKDKNHIVRSGVAQNPAAPIGILKILAKEVCAKEESQMVQARVAENPSTPESLRREIIEVLVHDLKPWIRCHVAWNKLAPAGVLRGLAKDKDPQVRSAVARNPATPIEVVVSLAEDEKFSVKAAVAENPMTPEEVLRKLASI